MNILGINGWGNWFHDTCASLIVKGQLAAICEEERFTRRKHASTAPVNAAQWCMRSMNLEWKELDGICVGWDLNYYGPMLTPPHSHEDFARKLLEDLCAPSDFPLEKIYFFKHHLCHAYSVIGIEPAKDGLVLVLDGQGEEKSTSLYRYEAGRLVNIITLGSSCSLGYFYEAASSAAGFGLNGTGKLMGLSSLGSPQIDFFDCNGKESGFTLKFPYSSKLSGVQSEDFDDAKLTVDGYWLPLFHKEISELPKLSDHQSSVFEVREKLDQNKNVKDFAASAQGSLENAVGCLLKHHLKDTDTSIFLTGGVALNCKNNGALLTKFDIDLYLQPLSNDAGVSLGAAFYYAHLKHIPVDCGEFPFLGPFFSEAEILTAIESRGLKYLCIDEPWHVAAELISRNYIIGWFQGKAEVGPRALGARSILAKPDMVAIRNRINQELKKRESWRPFGPSIMEELASTYFDKCASSRYMLIGFRAKSEIAKRSFAGTIHVDGTARIQTVPADTPNLSFRYLLESFYKITGIPGVLNTSFNRAGEPIVCTPEDALNAFLEMGLDALIIGKYLIKGNKSDCQ